MAILHIPDFLILPFDRTVKSDLNKILLSAVSADGLYFSTDVPVIFIKKSDHRPMCLGDFESHFCTIPPTVTNDDPIILDFIVRTIKSHNPHMTPFEDEFLTLYFQTLKAFTYHSCGAHDRFHELSTQLGLPPLFIYESPWAGGYNSNTDVWRALLPIPELQLYVHDPLATQ